MNVAVVFVGFHRPDRIPLSVFAGPPGVINNLLASDATLSSITLSWNDGADPVVPASGATGYQVSYAAIINGMEGPTTIFAEDVDVTTRVVEVTGLEFGVLYRFTVQTRNLYASGYQPGVSQDVRVEGASPILAPCPCLRGRFLPSTLAICRIAS